MEVSRGDLQQMKQSWVGAEFSNRVYSATIPLHWKIILEDGVLSFSNGSDDMAIVISLFTSEDSSANFDTTWHLERYLQSANSDQLQVIEKSFNHSYAKYRDAEDRIWHVACQAERPHLLLITLNFSSDLQAAERETCLASFQSVGLVKGGW